MEKIGSAFRRQKEGFLYIDGSCRNNGQKNAIAGVGVWIGYCHPLNLSKRVDPKYPQTNNTAEIMAAKEACDIAKIMGYKKVCMITDSQFLIQCYTKYLPFWSTNGWKTQKGQKVRNKGPLKALQASAQGLHIRFMHVKAHSSNIGNCNADKLAKEAIAKNTPDLRLHLQANKPETPLGRSGLVEHIQEIKRKYKLKSVVVKP